MSNKTIVDSKQAISVFLESLLKETELPEAVAVAEQMQTVEPAEEPVVRPVEAETSLVQENKLLAADKKKQAIQPPELPVSAEEVSNVPFQALMFKVAGLSLAVRLVELSGVLEWDESKLTEMPGHSAFYMGLLQYLGKSIPVIDTARLVFPEDKLIALSADNPLERVTRIVLIDDGKWGLACDEIAEVIELSHDDVKWRQQRSQRKWMAGTVIQHMCALVDAKGFSEMLEEGSHNRK